MRQDRRGFSLVETMVVIGIFGLLAALSLPAFSSYVRNNRLSTSVDRFAADLQLARSTAIASGRVVQVAVRTDGYAVTGNDICGNFSAGYAVTDVSTGTVLTSRDFESGVAVSAASTVRFFPWGQSDAHNFSVGGCSGTSSRTVNLLPTGAVEVH